MITVNAGFYRRRRAGRIEHKNITKIVVPDVSVGQFRSGDERIHERIRKLIRTFSPGPDWFLGGYADVS